jgi:hypothetical protein
MDPFEADESSVENDENIQSARLKVNKKYASEFERRNRYDELQRAKSLGDDNYLFWSIVLIPCSLVTARDPPLIFSSFYPTRYRGGCRGFRGRRE